MARRKNTKKKAAKDKPTTNQQRKKTTENGQVIGNYRYKGNNNNMAANNRPTMEMSNKNISFMPNSTNTSKNRQKFTDVNKEQHQANGSAKGGHKMYKSPSTNTLGRIERQYFVLWKRPFRTIQYFLLEVLNITWIFIKSFLCIKRLLPTVLIISAIVWLYLMPGAHTKYFKLLEKKIYWCLYWVGLGVLSSVGLGTGLHTFLLYLGPHIARVTLAAFECNSLDFPEPPYPDDVTCPTSAQSIATTISLWAIISKVRLESLMWGAGTALGELPPYFMAKAARVSGEEPDDVEYKEFLSFVEGDIQKKEMSSVDKIKLWMERVVTRIGFPGILLFASIPNPFFDLAGITCGHFLIPFWTFFGATLIGKAIVKMHVQMLFVVLTFSEHHIEHLVTLLKRIPHVGHFIQAPLKEFLRAQKLRLHRNPNDPIPEQASSLVQQVMSYVVTAMIVWFIISLINSLAQRYHKRIWESNNNELVKKKNLKAQ